MKIIKNAVSFWLFMLLNGLTASASADSEALCPDKTLDTVAIEALYLGTECYDFCYALFRLDNGDEIKLIADEEDAAKLFGRPGGRVSATYEVRQSWVSAIEGEEPFCFREPFLNSGGPLKKTEPGSAGTSSSASNQPSSAAGRPAPGTFGALLDDVGD